MPLIISKTNAKKLQDAFEKRSLSLLKEVFSEPGVDVNAYSDGGYTPLLEAALKDWTKGIEFLLTIPTIDVNLPKKNNGNTALHLAVLHKAQCRSLRPLLKLPGVNVNARNDDGETALSCAIAPKFLSLPSRWQERQDRDAIRLILNYPELDLNPTEVHRLLLLAFGGRDSKILSILLSNPRVHREFENFSNDQIKKLWGSGTGIWYWMEELLAYRVLIHLLKEKHDLTLAEIETVLPRFTTKDFAKKVFKNSKVIACHYETFESFMLCFGFEAAVKLSEQSIVMPALTGESTDEKFVRCATAVFETPLIQAAECFYLEEHQPFFEWLLKSDKINVNQENKKTQETALHIAVKRGNLPLVKLLLEHKQVDPTIVDAEGNLPLHIAMENNDLKIVELLLQHSKAADLIHAKNNEGNTPLHMGLKNGSVEACKVLLMDARLTDGTSLNDKQETLLHCLARNDNNLELSPLFFEKFDITKPDFNAKDREGFSAFFIAARHAPQIAEIFLYDQRMDLTSADRQGFTVLHQMIQAGNLNAVKFLIEQSNLSLNAEVIRSKYTPLHIAAKHYAVSPEIFFILFNHPDVDVNAQDSRGNTPSHLLLEESKAIHLVEERANFIFNEPRLNINLQNSQKKSLLACAANIDSIVVFKCLIDRLRRKLPQELILWGENTIPHPEINPVKFASSRLMNGCYKIKTYYAVLSVLKKNQHRKYDEVFEVLKQEKFPQHETWSEEHKKIAFYHAQYTLGLMPEHLFALIVFYCDGLLQLKKSEKDAERLNQDAVGLNQHVVDLNQAAENLNQNPAALNQGAADSDIESVLESNARRFFTMARQLPLELQMKLCNVAAGQSKELIPSQDSEFAFKDLAAKCVP